MAWSRVTHILWAQVETCTSQTWCKGRHQGEDLEEHEAEWNGKVEIRKREIPGTTWSMCGYILTYPWLGEPSAVLGSPKVGTLISASSVSHPCSDTQTKLTHNIQHAKVYPEARKETDGKFPVKNFATWWIKPNCSLIQCNSSSSCMHESPEFKILHKWDQRRLENWNYLQHKPTCQNHGLYFLSNHYFDLAQNKQSAESDATIRCWFSSPWTFTLSEAHGCCW